MFNNKGNSCKCMYCGSGWYIDKCNVTNSYVCNTCKTKHWTHTMSNSYTSTPYYKPLIIPPSKPLFEGQLQVTKSYPLPQIECYSCHIKVSEFSTPHLFKKPTYEYKICGNCGKKFCNGCYKIISCQYCNGHGDACHGLSFNYKTHYCSISKSDIQKLKNLPERPLFTKNERQGITYFSKYYDQKDVELLSKYDFDKNNHPIGKKAENSLRSYLESKKMNGTINLLDDHDEKIDLSDSFSNLKLNIYY